MDHRSGVRVIQHRGGINGFGTSYVRLVDRGVVIVVWTNVGNLDPSLVSEMAIDLLLGNPVEIVEEIEPLPFLPEEAARITGAYRLTEKGRANLAAAGLQSDVIDSVANVRIHVNTNRVVMEIVGSHSIRLHRAGPFDYFGKRSNSRLFFLVEHEEQKPSGIRIRWNGIDLIYDSVASGDNK